MEPKTEQTTKLPADLENALAALRLEAPPALAASLDTLVRATIGARDHALDYAWTVIANKSGGDWTRESPDWQAAAAKWRDEYHQILGTR